MKRILLSALALGAMTTAAAAEPQRMTEAEMGDVVAGLSTNTMHNVLSNTATAAAIGLPGLYGAGTVPASAGTPFTNATAVNTTNVSNDATVHGTDAQIPMPPLPALSLDIAP